MDDLYGPVQSWVGLLDALGVGAVALAWYFLADAGDRVRTGVLAFGALFVILRVATVTATVASFASLLVLLFRNDSTRGSGHLLLLLAGLALGIAAVLVARRRYAAADPAGDDEVTVDELADDPSSAPPADQAASVDAAAFALALAIPVVSTLGVFFGGGFAQRGGTVTVQVGSYHVLTGVVSAAPLLVLAGGRAGNDALVRAAFALVALRAVVVPLWAEAFANEYWAVFATGLVGGLLLAAVWGLLARVFPLERDAAVAAGLAALMLLGAVFGLRSELTTGVALPRGAFDDDGPADVVPSGFPTDFPVPTDFPFPTDFPVPTDFPFPTDVPFPTNFPGYP